MGKTTIKNEIKVIESGTDGIWTYRKWSDGTAECWGKYDATIACTTAYGIGVYYGSLGTRNFPNGLFVSTSRPTVVATRNANSSGTAFIQIYNISNTSFSGEVVNAASGNLSCYIAFYAIGKWK